MVSFITAQDSYIVNPEHLSSYNFYELCLLTHTEESLTGLEAYINNLNLLGLNTFKISDFEVRVNLAAESEKPRHYTLEITKYLGSKLRKHITIPPYATSIGVNAFNSCEALKSVTLPDTIKSICEGAFENSGLNEIEIPESVYKIEDFAFRSCSNLSKVKLPERLEYIGIEAFKDTNIKEICIPDLIEDIEDATFHFCENLKTVHLPKKLKRLKMCAFSHTAIEDITIPDEVEFIGTYAFSNSNLKEVKFPRNLKEINSCAFNSVNIEEANLPDSVVTIYDSAFAKCDRLTKVKIPPHLTLMGEEVFKATPLESIVKEYVGEEEEFKGPKPEAVKRLIGKTLEVSKVTR